MDPMGDPPKSSFQDERPPELRNQCRVVFLPYATCRNKTIDLWWNTQQIPEAHYQDEFYMNCHICSKGSILSFPGCGTLKGRVDFYIPVKEWGVELLREGDRLAQHSGRFSCKGTYKKDLSLSDYVILDCRQTHPQIPHPRKAEFYSNND
jgi:hypothetical protein